MKLALVVAMVAGLRVTQFQCGHMPPVWDDYFHTYLHPCVEVTCHDANGIWGPCLPIPKELQ